MSALSTLQDRGRSLSALGQSSGSPFQYQWAVPGRNARPVLPMLSAPLTGAAGATDLELYEVPQGMRFFLTGVLVQLFGDGWAIGSTDLVMEFRYQGASIDRPVQYLNSIKNPLGSVGGGVFMLPCSVQFVALDKLVGRFTETGLIPAGGALLMGVFGYEVPESESFL